MVAAEHRVRSIIAPRGVAAGGLFTCECGWSRLYERLDAVLLAHGRHAFLERMRVAARSLS